MAKITDHGRDRLKQRAGFSKAAQNRMALVALREGLGLGDFSGKFRRYLDKIRQQSDGPRDIRIYGDFIFLFSTAGVLITMWQVPNEFRAAAVRAAKRRREALVQESKPGLFIEQPQEAHMQEPKPVEQPIEAKAKGSLPRWGQIMILVAAVVGILVIGTLSFVRC